MIRDDPSRSELIRPGPAVRVDPVRLLYLPQNGGLTSQHNTEKRRESFLIWPIFDRNFNLQMGKSLNSSLNVTFFS